MIIRILVVDPRPRKVEEDIIVFQVPEYSRAHELLTELLDKEGIEHTFIKTPPKRAT